MAVEITQLDSIGFQTLADVLSNSTGNEDSEWAVWVFLEEAAEGVVNKLIYTALVLALVEFIHDNDETLCSKDPFENVPFMTS